MARTESRSSFCVRRRRSPSPPRGLPSRIPREEVTSLMRRSRAERSRPGSASVAPSSTREDGRFPAESDSRLAPPAGSVADAARVASREEPRRRREGWALLAVALAIIIGPPLYERFRGVPVEVREVPLEPLMIDVETAGWYEWAL